MRLAGEEEHERKLLEHFRRVQQQVSRQSADVEHMHDEFRRKHADHIEDDE